MKAILWILFITFAIVIGLYPLIYLLKLSPGMLSSKSQEVLQSDVWFFAFYMHISFGAVALLTGWSQFSKKVRNKFLKWHRFLGKIYLIAVLGSGMAALYIAMFANGGLVSVIGFSGLAIGWLFTTTQAYVNIRKKEIDAHRYWMIRSYALCFAAVTLRIWLPFFQLGLHMDFIEAYRIIAWLCWVPNLIVAEMIVTNIKRNGRTTNDQPSLQR
ncbi:MAG: DUF2306 domain-containing protein [Bacteroidota bacterium]